MIRTYHGLYVAETPIHHASDERMETTAVCRSNMVVLPSGELRKCYNISSSTFRNVLRRHGAHRLFELLDLDIKSVPEIALVVLFSGGPRLEKSDTTPPIKFMKTCCHYFPLLDLLGATTIFYIMPGRLAATQLNTLTPMMNNFAVEKAVMDIHQVNATTLPEKVVEFQFNVKRDPREKFDDKTSGEELDLPDSIDKKWLKKYTETGVVANMFDIQIVRKGVKFANRIRIESHSEKKLDLLESCLASSIVRWQNNGGEIGGKAAQGCGVLSANFLPTMKSPEIYEKFVCKNKEVLRKLIGDRMIWKDKKAIFAHVELVSD